MSFSLFHISLLNLISLLHLALTIFHFQISIYLVFLIRIVIPFSAITFAVFNSDTAFSAFKLP